MVDWFSSTGWIGVDTRCLELFKVALLNALRCEIGIEFYSFVLRFMICWSANNGTRFHHINVCFAYQKILPNFNVKQLYLLLPCWEHFAKNHFVFNEPRSILVPYCVYFIDPLYWQYRIVACVYKFGQSSWNKYTSARIVACRPT